MSDLQTSQPHSIIKKALIISLVLIIVCILSVCTYTYYVVIPQQTEERVTKALNAFGFEKISLGNITRKKGAITFSNIALDEKKFSIIDELTVKYSLWRFLINPENAQTIHIKNIHLTGEMDKDFNLEIIGWNKAENITKRLHNIPANAVIIDKSRIDILSETLGGISISYNAYLNLSNPTDIKFRGSLNSRQKKISFQSKFNGTINSETGINLKGDIEHITLRYPNYSVKRGAGHIDLTYNDTLTYSAETQFSTAGFHKLPLKDVRATFDQKDKAIVILAEGATFGSENFNWNTKVNVTDGVSTSETNLKASKMAQFTSFLERNDVFQNDTIFPWALMNIPAPSLSISTRHSINNGLSGSFKITVPESPFEITGIFNKKDSTSNLAGDFYLEKTKLKSDHDQGKSFFDVSSNGTFKLNTATSPPSMKWIAVTDILDGLIDYGALSLTTKKSSIIYNTDNPKQNQRILLSSPLKKSINHRTYLSLGLTDDDKLLAENLNLAIYGGLVQTQGPVFTNNSLAIKNTLIVSDINLSPLFKDAGFKDISVSGQMGGLVPFKIKKTQNGHEIGVKSAMLQSLGTGNIQLPENIALGLFPGDTTEMEEIRAALANFHYEYFELRLDGNLTGRVLMTLSAKGMNPDNLKAKPIEINLQIENELYLILQNLMK